ncbi:MAG: sigma 54-interacting transcriptional regulator [Acidobacteria bacterium]|nr:sigma 54-interacting transcriptional regulator [Acidobacteriota bacterium]
MTEETFDQRIGAARKRLEAHRQRASASPEQQEVLKANAFEDLSVTVEELQIADEELRQQKDELAAAQTIVEAERQRYQELFEFAPDAYLVTDTEGVIQEANRGAATLLNVSQPTLVSKPLVVFVAKDDRQAFHIQLSRLPDERGIQEWELHLQPHEGTAFPAAVTIAAVDDAQGKLVGLRWLIRDITERKRAEAARARLTAILEMTTDFVGTADRQGRVLDINRAGRLMLGISEDEDISHTTIADCHPQWAYALIRTEGIPTALREGSWVGEAAFVTRDGREIPTSQVILAHRDASGQVEYLSTIARDITKRKRAEEGLRQAEEKFATAFRSSPDSISISRLADGLYIDVNDGFLLLNGYRRREEVIGHTALELNHWANPEDRDRLVRLLQEQRAVRDLEFNFRTRSGDIRVELLSAEIIELEGEQYMLAVRRDITERKQAEIQLAAVFAQVEKSREDMLSILNQLRLGTAMTDRDGDITFLSEVAQRLLGKSQEEALGRHWQQWLPLRERDKARVKAMAERPPQQRTKVPVYVEAGEGRHYWVETDVRDDPHDPQRKIFFFYDVSEVYDLRRLLDEKMQFHDLVGRSKAMQLVYQQIHEMAQVDITVLIEGETGTGKELVARAIHFASHRKHKPFIVVNCAGLTESLVASQLFGHRRGAFTGAIADQQGFFEAANGGTLFLDEIGDMPADIQRNLLRALEQKEIARLGESKPRKVDVRILAATNQNLSEAVAKGKFRPDLLYRIQVARIDLPPLRQRREDIPLLVEFFLRQSRAVTGKSVQEVSNEAMRILVDYSWPGNVRELKNAIEVAVIRCKGSALHADDLPLEIVNSAYPQLPSGDSPQDEKQRLLAALERARGNRTVAARLLGIGRSTFYRQLASLGIKPDK